MTFTECCSTATSRYGRSSTTKSPSADSPQPVRGPDPYQVAVGPIHAGVIESGHFRFHVVGDLILHVDARLFYKHRGLERAAEGLALADGLPVVARACAGCWVTNAVAYAHACEEALGLVPTPELARARTILLELERVWNTLNDIAAICAGVGLAAGTSRFTALVDDARRLNARLTGHRFLFGSVMVGASGLDLDEASVADARETLVQIRRDSSRAWHALLFNGSFMDRMPDIGVIADAKPSGALGVVGVAARAAGVADDVRTLAARGSPTRGSSQQRSGAPPATSKPDSNNEPSSSCPASTSSTASLPTLSDPPQQSQPQPRRRSASAGSKAHVGQHHASLSATGTASAGSGSEPAPTRTGPPSPSPQPATSCPTSR